MRKTEHEEPSLFTGDSYVEKAKSTVCAGIESKHTQTHCYTILLKSVCHGVVFHSQISLETQNEI